MTRPHACLGFDENVVLAVKNCFYEDDMRMILIKLTDNRISYHDRRCKGILSNKNEVTSKVSLFCTNWFNSLSLENEETKEDDSLLPDEDENDPTQINDEIISEDRQETSDHNKENTGNSPTAEIQEFSCDFCTKSFKLKASLDKHQLRNHRKQKLLQKFNRNGDFTCVYCGLAFQKKPSMHRHIQRNHPNETKDPMTIQEEEKSGVPLKCDMPGCKADQLNSSEYKNHLRTVHNLPRKGRKSKEPLDLDLANRLGLDETLSDVPYEEPEPCSYCQKPLESRVKMYWHIKRIHLQKKQKPCPLCGLLVKKLSDHMRRQHSESKDVKKLVCEFCGDSFKGNSGYRFHLAGHTGEKKYSCRSCGKHYRTSSESYNCERGHQGIYKWRCGQCPFKSHQRNKYVRHLRIHTKSQPYLCPLCEHRTARKDYLQKHILKSHCTMTSLTLDQIEKLYPNMYNIDEKIDIKAPISYAKLKLPLPLTSSKGEVVPLREVGPSAVEQSSLSIQQEHQASIEPSTGHSYREGLNDIPTAMNLKSKRLETYQEGGNSGRMTFIQQPGDEVGELSTLVVDHTAEADPGLQIVQSDAIDLHKAASTTQEIHGNQKINQMDKRPPDYVPKNVLIEFFPRYSHQRPVSGDHHQRVPEHSLRHQEQPQVHRHTEHYHRGAVIDPTARYSDHPHRLPEHIQRTVSYERSREPDDSVPREVYQRLEIREPQIVVRAVHREHSRLSDVDKVQIHDNSELVQNVVYVKRDDAVQINYIPVHREGESYIEMRDVSYEKT